jgi:hypothetical protein
MPAQISLLSESAEGMASEASSVGLGLPRNGGGFPARRKRARGAPVDERRLGPNVTCCLTKARSNRLLPTRLVWVWEQGASEIGLRALRAVDNAAYSEAPLRWGAPLHAAREESVESAIEAGGTASNEPPPAPKCCEALAGVGIERLL